MTLHPPPEPTETASPGPAQSGRASPKIELHVHLEGTIQPETLLELARRNDVNLPVSTVEQVRELFAFPDFGQFIAVWRMITECLRTPEDFRQVVVEYAGQAARDGAVYLEGIFSAAEPALRGTPWPEIFAGYAEGAAEAYHRHGVSVRLTPDIYRVLDPEIASDCARWAVRYADRGVVGFGLGGMETAAPAARFAEAFAIARHGGLGLVPHAGESAGAESVREILDLDPARIRHGIRAVEDPELLAELAARRVVLDVCPTSNLRTGAVASLDAHPLPQLRAAGIACSVSTDDPAMFDTDLEREYALAASLGVSPAEAYAAGLAGALCDQATRDRLVEVGRRHYAVDFSGS